MSVAVRRPALIWIVLAAVWLCGSAAFFVFAHLAGESAARGVGTLFCVMLSAGKHAHCTMKPDYSWIWTDFVAREIYWVVLPAIGILLWGSMIASAKARDAEDARLD